MPKEILLGDEAVALGAVHEWCICLSSTGSKSFCILRPATSTTMPKMRNEASSG
jgi:hypothetical protein